MAKSRKQGKSELMDEWLESQGLYRKPIAKDGSCLFRAVSEQVFNTQALHFTVRQVCIRYMERYREKFESFIEGPFEHYLFNLQNPKEWADHVEMCAMSLMFERDFLVFQEVYVAPYEATNNGFSDKIMLCFSQGNHYDSVYTKSFIADAATCQSLVYELLYKQVFQLGDEVDLAVEKMLHDKTYAKHRKDSTASQDSNWDKSESPSPDFLTECCDLDSYTEKEGGSEIRRALAQGIPPFPYKVAKALDADIYRNVEFDIWNDMRKEEPQFEPGVKCLIRLDKNASETFLAHIQEMSGEKGPVTVFVEELGERKTVEYNALEPLPSSPQKGYNWQNIGKSYKCLSGYYQKAPLNCSMTEIDKYKGKKKLNKKKFKEVTISIPLGRGQMLPPRLQQSQSKFEATFLPIGRGRASPLVYFNRSPSPRLKWTQPGQQNQRYRQKNTSGRFTPQGMNSSVDDSQFRNGSEKDIYELKERDLSAFPALPQKGRNTGRTSPNHNNNHHNTSVWGRANVPSNAHRFGNNQLAAHHMNAAEFCEQNCNKKFETTPTTEFHNHNPHTPTPPIPILQPSPAHTVSTNLSISNSPNSPVVSSPPPPSPTNLSSLSLSNPLESLSQNSNSSQSSGHILSHPPPQHSQLPSQPLSAPQQLLPPPPPQQHLQQQQQQQLIAPSLPLTQQVPPPPPSMGYIPLPFYSSGMIMTYNENPSQPVNYNVGRSQDPSGNDLPLSDLPTLRFFYNLGHDYFRMSSIVQMQPQQQPYPMWNYGGTMTFTPVNNGFPPIPGSESEVLEESIGSNGQSPLGKLNGHKVGMKKEDFESKCLNECNVPLNVRKGLMDGKNELVDPVHFLTVQYKCDNSDKHCSSSNFEGGVKFSCTQNWYCKKERTGSTGCSDASLESFSQTGSVKNGGVFHIQNYANGNGYKNILSFVGKSNRALNLPPRFQKKSCVSIDSKQTLNKPRFDYEGQPLLQVDRNAMERSIPRALSTLPLSNTLSSKAAQQIQSPPPSYSGMIASPISYPVKDALNAFPSTASPLPTIGMPHTNSVLPSPSPVGYYPSPGSPASTPAVLATSPAVYFSPTPYLYQQPPPISTSVPHQVSFLPAAAQ